MLRRTDDRRRRRMIGSVDPDIPWHHVMRTEAPRNVRGLSSESVAGCLRNAVRFDSMSVLFLGMFEIAGLDRMV